ncbi:hypothetical protein NDU88_009133 [Pleurodeles waltl]|uniref:Uncharacterized protein n=1 Tax=Pleurodeles waltl TaxID=8319 RepID=A0AAV7PRK2_PLEWA|nr:hypothetical protein NDU88_009133 [Pleurodeles waltl]
MLLRHGRPLSSGADWPPYLFIPRVSIDSSSRPSCWAPGSLLYYFLLFGPPRRSIRSTQRSSVYVMGSPIQQISYSGSTHDSPGGGHHPFVVVGCQDYALLCPPQRALLRSSFTLLLVIGNFSVLFPQLFGVLLRLLTCSKGWGFQPKFYDPRLGSNQFFTLLRGHLLLRSLCYACYSRLMISSGPRLTLVLPGVTSSALSILSGFLCSCPGAPGGRYLSRRSAGRRGAPPEASVPHTFPGGQGGPPSLPLPGARSLPHVLRRRSGSRSRSVSAQASDSCRAAADRSSVPAGRAGRKPGDLSRFRRTQPQLRGPRPPRRP